MEDKFYTPNISEFHVGFEYERFQNNIWFDKICDIYDLSDIKTLLNKQNLYNISKICITQEQFINSLSLLNINTPKGLTLKDILKYKNSYTDFIRVKYLDIEDIESLGFKYIGEKLDGQTLQEFKMFNSRYFVYLECTWLSNKIVIKIETSVEDNSERTLVVHSIGIKNKSELQVLLKQLNII